MPFKPKKVKKPHKKIIKKLSKVSDKGISKIQKALAEEVKTRALNTHNKREEKTDTVKL